MNKRKYIIILILLMVIGFASVSTILRIGGTTTVGENAKDFDVYFSKAYLNGVEHNEFISSDGKNINFGISELKNTGESLILKYEITNSSSQYDADVNLLLSDLNITNDHVTIQKEEDYNGCIGARGVGTGTIIVTLKKPVTESENIDFNLNFGIDAVEKTIGDMNQSYSPNNPKPNEYTVSGVLTDKDGNPLKDKVVVIKTANGLQYTETDLEGNIFKDNLPQGTLDLYVFDDKTQEEVKGMTLEEITNNADGHIKLTTSTTGNQKGEEIEIKDISLVKTETIQAVQIKIGDKTINKEVGENNEVIFNLDTNVTEIELPVIGKQDISPGENKFEITLENGKTITIVVNNRLPTAPEITGGSSSFINTEEVVISIAQHGTALSDVVYYEYIISDKEITDFSNIEKTGTTTNSITINTEGDYYVYYRTVSKNGTTSVWSNPETVKLDSSSPEVTIRSTTSTSNSININFEAEDKYSGIKSITCKYGEDDYTEDGEIQDGVCKLSELKNDTIYKYQICASDIAGNDPTCKTSEAGTKEIHNPKITFDSVESTTGDYYLGQTAKVVFDNENIKTPTYYIKTTRKGTTNIGVTEVCGTDTLPDTCTTISATTSLDENVWYKVTGNIDVSYTESYNEYSEIIALTYDGKNYSGVTTGTIGKIAYRAIDIEYTNALAPNVTNVQEAIDDLYNKLK